MKRTFLLIGMTVCFGAIYAQEQQSSVHVTPVEVRAIPTLNEQLIKIEAKRTALATSSREGAAMVQKELLVLQEQYRQMLEKEMSLSAGKTLEALKEEFAIVSAQLNATVQR